MITDLNPIIINNLENFFDFLSCFVYIKFSRSLIDSITMVYEAEVYEADLAILLAVASKYFRDT
ncbi:MAG: hypothetical protein RLZZ490_1139 [Cyanobacteriota bacterium]